MTPNLMNLHWVVSGMSPNLMCCEAAIAAEGKHPAGDDVRILELKRKKLRLKDEIQQLRAG
jgi:hypothetical protein